jgi:hypothetical protein
MATEKQHNLSRAELALLRSLASGRDWDLQLSRSTAPTTLYKLRQLGLLVGFEVTAACRAALNHIADK